MGTKTSKDSKLKELLEHRIDAMKKIEKAETGLKTVEKRIGRWLREHLGEIYENWSPRVGGQAVRIVLGRKKPDASLLRVMEIYGRRISFADNVESRWRISLDLEHFQRHLPDPDDHDSDHTVIEIIVPPDAYDEKVRHWLGLRKRADELPRES